MRRLEDREGTIRDLSESVEIPTAEQQAEQAYPTPKQLWSSIWPFIASTLGMIFESKRGLILKSELLSRVAETIQRFHRMPGIEDHCRIMPYMKSHSRQCEADDAVPEVLKVLLT